MTLTRRRFKQTTSLQRRLEEHARQARERAHKLPPGREQDALLKRARQDETVAHLDEWLNSPGLLPPE